MIAGMALLETIFTQLVPCRYKSLEQGEILFHQSDSVEYIYLVRSGKIRLSRCTVDGNAVVLQLATAGEMIAEASLFSDHYHCQARVEESVAELRCFDRNKLLDALAQSSDAAMQVLAIFARQIRRQREMLEIRNIRSAKQRIYSFLELAADARRGVAVRQTYKDMAYQLGLAHETFYRSLKQLEDEGKLRKEVNSIQLL